MKKTIAMLLALLLVAVMLPVTAMADDVAPITVSTEEELIAALKAPVSGTIELQNDITLTANWVGVAVPKNTVLVINGNGHTIYNMTVSNYLNPGQGGDDPMSGHAASYYAGFIGNNSGTLTINNLKFYNALVDMKPADTASGSSILAVVCANNSGDLTMNDVEVDNSTVKGYSKAGILSGFSQGAGRFVANHCAITNCTVVAEADGTDPEASVNGLIIGYDSYKKAKTNGIKLENNKVEIDSSVEWVDGIKYNENGSAYGINNAYAAAGYAKLGIVSTTYTQDSYGLKDVVMVAQYDGYWYETAKDAIAARGAESGNVNESVEIKADGNKVTFDKAAADNIMDTVGDQNITLEVKSAAADSGEIELYEDQAAAIADKPNAVLVELTMKLNGELIYTGGENSGKATITIPYIGANASTKVYYIEESGNLIEMKVTGYTASTVTFETTHFSKYVVTTSSTNTITIIVPSEGGSTATTPEKNPSTGANDFVGAAVAVAVISALGAAAVVRKK